MREIGYLKPSADLTRGTWFDGTQNLDFMVPIK